MKIKMDKNKKNLPLGVKIICGLNYLFSFLFLVLLGSLIKNNSGISDLEGLEILFMGVCLSFALSFLFAGIGLQKLKSWGRSLSVLTLVMPFITITYLLLSYDEGIVSLNLIITILLNILLLIMMIYLTFNKNLKEVLKE